MQGLRHNERKLYKTSTGSNANWSEPGDPALRQKSENKTHFWTRTGVNQATLPSGKNPKTRRTSGLLSWLTAAKMARRIDALKKTRRMATTLVYSLYGPWIESQNSFANQVSGVSPRGPTCQVIMANLRYLSTAIELWPVDRLVPYARDVAAERSPNLQPPDQTGAGRM